MGLRRAAVLLGLLQALAACGSDKQQTRLPIVACADPVKGCHAEMAGGPVRVWFSEKPSPMRAFEVSIDAPHLKEIRAEFAMAGMDMGPGRYQFLRGQDGVFRSRTTLPVCMAGRSDWTMTLNSGKDSLVIPFQAGQ